jgi:hypothetical protein
VTAYTFDIKDPISGRVIAQHHRIDRPGERKQVWWTHGATKGLPTGIGVADLPLYESEIRLKRREPLLLVEGEKSVEALAEVGIHAYGTVTGAASAPTPDALRTQVAGHHVLFWPDADEAGMEHAAKVLGNCRKAGADMTGIIDYRSDIAPLPKGFDAADMVGFGPDALEPPVARAIVGAFIENWARRWEQPLVDAAIEWVTKGLPKAATGSVCQALFVVWGIDARPGQTVKCPMHGDRAASLWIAPDDDRAICMTPSCMWAKPGADAAVIRNIRIELR